MGHQTDQRFIAGDDRGRRKGQPRVFHAAEGEGRRQHQQVIATPAVRAVQRLGGLDHGFDIGQLGGCGLQTGRLGVHAGALAQGLEGEITNGQRDQVRRDGLVHDKAPGAAVGQHFAFGRELFGAHHHPEFGRGGDAGRPGLADAGAVLGGYPGAGQDGLALTEQIRMLLAGGLRWRQPLQRSGIRAGVIAHQQLARAA